VAGQTTETEIASDKITGATRARNEPARPNNAPFFLIGAPRSGTTLLRLILLGHSRLHIPPESWFLEDLVRELPLADVLTAEQVGRAVGLVTNHRRWEDFTISSETFRQQVAAGQQLTLRDIVDLIYREELDAAGKLRFGDKSPSYFKIVPELLALYPGAQFIHLIRDGRDVAISSIDAKWARYYERKLFVWLEAMKVREIHRRSRYADRIFEVRYEDLVQDPETVIRAICAFLGESFEDGMLEWQQRVDATIPAREMHVHRRIRGDIDSRNIAIWKSRLSAFECFSMEACLRAPLARLGYALRFASPVWRPLLDAWGRTLNLSAPILRRVLPALQRRKLLPARMYF